MGCRGSLPCVVAVGCFKNLRLRVLQGIWGFRGSFWFKFLFVVVTRVLGACFSLITLRDRGGGSGEGGGWPKFCGQLNKMVGFGCENFVG